MNLRLTGCIEISSFPANGDSADKLIKKADFAMYAVKQMKKDKINIYVGER